MYTYVIEPKTVTIRTVGVINELLKRRIVKNAVELSEILEIDNIQISQVRHGKRDFPKKHLYELVRSFNVNHDYLFSSNEKMFVYDMPPIPENGIRFWCDLVKINTVTWGFQILLSGRQEKIIEIVIKK